MCDVRGWFTPNPSQSKSQAISIWKLKLCSISSFTLEKDTKFQVLLIAKKKKKKKKKSH